MNKAILIPGEETTPETWYDLPNALTDEDIENYTEVPAHFKFGELGKAIQWCRQQSDKDFRLRSRPGLTHTDDYGWETPYNFYFEDEGDALAFKLKWG
jgi:hypothetical protein